ncbi:MAG TPA: non-heme iron oxygenase ferredoxin subunit [Actinomycetota bacterium]|nr:non-heme iron oxygenase ferredoxin subunit [Actinomycetota bacterium]
MGRFEVVARLDELPEGDVVQVVAHGEPLGLYRVGDAVYAISDVCTHEEAYLSDGEFDPDELEVECPLHGSRFNVETGDVRILPATTPVAAYQVKVEGGLVLVGPPKSRGDAS